MIDLHCHITAFKNPQKVLEKALQTLEYIVCPTLSLEDLERTLKITQGFSQALVAGGWHPTTLPYPNPKEWQKTLEEFVKEKRIQAIGEVGLDTKYGPELKKQEELLRAQLEVAQKHNLPVILHLRGSGTERILQIVKDFPQTLIVWHSCALARQELFFAWKKLGLGFSFGLNLLRPYNLQHTELLEDLAQPFFFETDSPYVGSSVPWQVQKVYTTFSEITHIPLEHLKEVVKNYFAYYFLKKREDLKTQTLHK